MLLVTNGDDNDAGGLQQLAGEQQSTLDEGKPLAVSIHVVGSDVLVVVDPTLVAGVVRRIDVDAVDLAGVGELERFRPGGPETGLTWAFVVGAGEENRTPVFSLGS